MGRSSGAEITFGSGNAPGPWPGTLASLSGYGKMVRAATPEHPVGEGVASLEVRWILPGQLDTAVAAWFGRFPARAETREDVYLLDPHLPGLSVKMRGTAVLDVKVYGGTPGLLEVPGRACGHLESWVKWSFACERPARVSDDLSCWRMVRKARRIINISMAGKSPAAGAPGQPQPRCEVELTDIRTSGEAWWSLGFEATGPVGLLRAELDAAAALVFAQALPGGLELGTAHAGSYEDWLRRPPRQLSVLAAGNANYRARRENGCCRPPCDGGDPIILLCAIELCSAASGRRACFRTREAIGGVDERLRQARLLYERAVFGGGEGPLADADRELDAVEADLSVARGRLMHTRFLLRRDEDPDQAVEDTGELALFERAAHLYQALGDLSGEAEALFWVGCFHQVVRRDNAAAVPALERSLDLASQAGDKVTMSEALRHLGIQAHATGRLEVARQRLEESTRLRRETGQLPGVAANLIGLAYIAAGQGRRDDALALLDEASAIAGAHQAQRILRQVSEARRTF
jgi:tetratricopeptide (TPR) repeat protein